MAQLFWPEADANWITVKRGNQFAIKLTPAETDKATQLIGIALGMETLDSLPSHINNSPFVVRFFEDNKLALERQDIEGSIPFDWPEADALIIAIQDGLKIAINERTLIKGARGTGHVPINEGPFL